MRDLELAAAIRALRQRRGWRQSDLAAHAGVSQRHVSRVEHGQVNEMTVRALRAVGAAVGADIALLARWRGGELARLADADHAAVQTSVSAWLATLGWDCRAEVTFSEWGERGSIDVLAFHPGTRVLLVIEVKTVIADVGGLLRGLDSKTRLANRLARRIGWAPTTVVACLVVVEGTTNRRRIAAHAPLFDRFLLRGHAARRWLRSLAVVGAHPILVYWPSPHSRGTAGRRAGRRRVRVTNLVRAGDG